MNKTGVIQIIDSLNVGGAEVLAVNIANGLSETEINSHICVTRVEGVLKNNVSKKVGYLFLSRSKTIDIKALLKFRKYVKNNKIGILHAHATSSFFAFCVKILCPKIKVIWHNHYGGNIKLKGNKLFLLKITSYFFDSVITVNSVLKTWTQQNLLCNKIIFLNNYSIFNNFESTTILNGIEGKRIVHVAGFREDKDHKNLISSFKIFKEHNKDWSLHLVGKLYDDLYTREILELIEKLGLEKHIFVYDVCIDIANILNQSTIGVLSSKYEGLPISLLEYGLAKLPVIVTNVGECSIVVEHNKSGIIVAPENSLELAKAFSTLANSEEKRNDFSELHNSNVKKLYSKESFINQLFKIYTA
ncbi:MAG: glycosyltransferase [Polaribacter sp.]|uniref:glycosyltransferase n=1 Tax=Polaribacter sp. TaxID=1920175 RepID=UPI002F3581F3